MKERPILFSAPMVRALLDGSKTQTRRIVKPAPPANTYKVMQYHHPDPRPHYYAWIDSVPPGPVCAASDWAFPCPYGQPGDRLWVRETMAHGIHALSAIHDGDGPFVYAATDSPQQRLGDKWTPSIHMPRAASRINLELVNVRVERLQHITEPDAKAEGVSNFGNITDQATGEIDRDAVEAYQQLWESINGAGSWDANPWVWVVEFKLVVP